MKKYEFSKNLKKLFIGFLTGVMLSSMATTSFAATSIDLINLDLRPEEGGMVSGETISCLEPFYEDDRYYIEEISTTKENPTPKMAYTYTIELIPEDGYAFNNNTAIKVNGATSLTVKSRNSSKIVLKAKTYPFHVLETVSNIQISDGGIVTWDKVPYSKNYSVYVFYTNNNGNEKVVKKSAKTETLDISRYTKRYDDVYVSVKANKGSTAADKFIEESYYVFADGSIDEDHSDEDYEVVFDVPCQSIGAGSSTSTSTGAGSSNANLNISAGSSSGPAGSNTTNTNTNTNTEADGWHGSGDSWYYIHQGKRVTGWLSVSGDWYLMDSTGNMLHGWQKVNNQWYFLNTNHDGTFGKMLTGWVKLDNKYYYLSPTGDSTHGYGTLWMNTTTPDGFKVGSDGAWIQ